MFSGTGLTSLAPLRPLLELPCRLLQLSMHRPRGAFQVIGWRARQCAFGRAREANKLPDRCGTCSESPFSREPTAAAGLAHSAPGNCRAFGRRTTHPRFQVVEKRQQGWQPLSSSLHPLSKVDRPLVRCSPPRLLPEASDIQGRWDQGEDDVFEATCRSKILYQLWFFDAEAGGGVSRQRC